MNSFIDKDGQSYIPDEETIDLVGRTLVYYLGHQESKHQDRTYSQTGYTVLCKELGINYPRISLAISKSRKGDFSASVPFHVAVKLIRAMLVRKANEMGKSVVKGVIMNFTFQDYDLDFTYQSDTENAPLTGELSIEITQHDTVAN